MNSSRKKADVYGSRNFDTDNKYERTFLMELICNIKKKLF